MRTLSRSLVFVVTAILLAGCFGASAPTGTDLASDEPPASVSASAIAGSQPASAAASGNPSAEPTDDLGPFSCDLPIHGDATVARTNITDVRVGTHDGYDRVVFEFSDGIPEGSLERATPPFTHDASGAPIEVEGSSFLRLILRGGTKQTDSGASSYDGPVDFDPAMPMLVDLIEGGDFEAQSTWYFGLTGEACVRVMTLVGEGGASRLVIDVEH